MSDEWVPRRLKDVAWVNPRESALPEDAPFIAMADVAEWGRWAVPSGTRGSRSGVRAQSGDTLVARITPCLENGKIAMVPMGCGRVGGSTEFIVLRAQDSILPQFLYLWAQSAPVHQAAVDLMIGTSGRKRVSGGDLGELPITVPPVPLQRRIVDLMEHLDTHIANLDAESERSAGWMDRLRHSFFAPLINRKPFADVLQTVRAGGTPNRKRPEFFGGGIPWLKSGEVDSQRITVTAESLTERGLAESSAWMVPEGSVVVAMYGQGDTKGTAGYLVESVSTNQAVLALVPDPAKTDGRFLLHWMRWHTDRLRAAATGAAQPNLSKAIVLREVTFPDIPVEDQKGLAAILDAALDTAEGLAVEAAALREARGCILGSLLERRLDLGDDYQALLAVAS